MTKFLRRFRDASYPYGGWHPFPPNAVVQVKNAYGETRIGLSKEFWWGYKRELDRLDEAVITRARRLDRPKGVSK